MKGFIQKYILPEEVDFDQALQHQVDAARNTVLDLCGFCLQHDFHALEKIRNDEHQCRKLKDENLLKLLNVFITPYDRESIYRIINQLDWVALSVKHLAIDLLVFKVRCPDSYRPIISALSSMANTLSGGFDSLGHKEFSNILSAVNKIGQMYDETAEHCALSAARNLDNGDIRLYLTHREILSQFKEVAKRIHVSANTLEDLAIKIV